MKLVFLTLAFVGLAVNALPVEEQRINGENGWYVPKIDGTFEWVDRAAGEAHLEALERQEVRLFSTNIVKFYLYTKTGINDGQQIEATRESLDASAFNAAHPVKFTIHGWNSNYRDGVNSGPRRAWFSHGDYNMIAVDWARGRSADYASSVAAIPGVGQKVAALIDFIHVEYGVPLENFEVIGHSLGAHVAGFTGKQVQSGQVHAVFGLDPAMPLFSYEKPEKRMASTDAFYVESIQTNGGKLGFLKPIGKGAFYPNGGKLQPGCGMDLDGGCSHGRSVTYYIEAVEIDDFPTMKCENYLNAVNNECGSTYSLVRMGARANAFMVDGDYYVPVNSEAPFGYAGGFIN